MKEELENRLIKRFPMLYRPNQYGCNQEKFGFECMDGYFETIWKASEEIESAFKKYPIIYSESFSIVQVKSKFRELRIYWKFDETIYPLLDKQTLDMIRSALIQITDKAEKESKSICECCGKKVDPSFVSNGWTLKCCDCAGKKETKGEQ